jgi:hypothetical protein
LLATIAIGAKVPGSPALKRQSGGKFAEIVCVVHPPPVVATAAGRPSIRLLDATHLSVSAEDVLA